MTLPTRSEITTTVVAVLAVLGLAACSTVSPASDPTTTSTSRCLAPPATPESSKPVVAVLTGITAEDQSPPIDATRSAAMAMIVNAGFAMQARLVVDVVAGGVGGADLAINTQLQATGPNELFHQADVTCKKVGVSAAFARLLHQTAPGPEDVLGALRLLQSHLTGLTKGPIDVVLLSNMLNGTDPLLLTAPGAFASGPAALVDAVVGAGLLPVCAGWNVYLVGGGRTAAGGVSDATNAELQSLWSAFFARCGGRLVLYDSQITQFPVRAAAPPPKASSTPAPAALPESRQHIGGHTEVTVALPDSVLFASGSGSLTPGTDTVLERLLTVVTKQYSHGPIKVTGYTDSVPIARPGDNVALSQERAEAVVAWLIGHGVPATRLSAAGEGSADPVGDNATASGRAENRRVDVAITLPASRS